MDAFRILQHRLRSLFRKDKLDLDLDDELHAHIELATEANIATGMDAKAARRAALRSFGGITQTKESYRAQRGLPILETIAADLRYALRQLFRAPGFAATAILTLALGLGANTAVFSLINALLLRPLPVPHAEALSVLHFNRTDMGGAGYHFCAPLFRAIEKRHDIFSSAAAYSDSTIQLRTTSGLQETAVLLVSGQFFQVMETPPLLGRYLTPADDRPGSPNGIGVVISESFWRSWFGGATDIVGRKLAISNAVFTVVGVMPKSFIGADATSRPNIYIPLSAEAIIDAPYDNLADGYGAWWLQILARRNPHVSVEQARSALSAQVDSLLRDSGVDEAGVKTFHSVHFQMSAESGSRGYNALAQNFRKPLLLVFALCAGVLLLACLNLACLLMARAAARERELATRLAIGATRGRLIQQLLVETFLIATLGTAAGLAASPAVSRLLAAVLIGNSTDTVLDTSLDPIVFGFAAVVALTSTLLIGLLPALRATSGNLNDHIKQGSQTRSAQAAHHWVPRALMSAEIAVALIIVVGAGLLATSLVRLYRTSLGFNPTGLVNLHITMDAQFLKGDALILWYRQYADALRHLPGVTNVSYEMLTPLTGAMQLNQFHSPLSPKEQQILGNEVAPNYFATMQTRLLSGREFTWEDLLTASSGQPEKIILNQSAAQMFFPGQNPLGQTVFNYSNKAYEVIAVAEDVRYASVRDDPPPTAYRPVKIDPKAQLNLSAVVRISGSNSAYLTPFAAALRPLTARVAPEIPAPVLTTMSSQLDDSIRSERMMAMLSVFFAVGALLVTGIGLYGTLAYATARRTSEIGIRMALGAQRTQVIGMIFRANAAVAICGVAAGLLAAMLASRVLASLLYGTSTRDPWVMVGSVVALAVIASAASLMPALRASRIEPMEALRTE